MLNDSRAQVVDGVVRLVASGGVEAATVRRVAAEVGVSIGMVQHHFRTKDAMLHAAMEAVGASFRARAAAACDGLDAGNALRAMVGELLPLDGTRLAEGRVWLAFVARAAVDPALGAEHARSWAALEDVLAELLARHRDVAVDAARADGRFLLAVLDGLAVGGAAEPARLTPERIRAVVDPVLDRLLAE